MSGRQVRRMRSLMRLLLSVVFAALVFTAGSALVKGPEAAADMPAAPPSTPMLVQSAVVPADNVLPQLPERRQEVRAAAVHTDSGTCSVDFGLVSDGNGWPVTARTWTKAVYSVCPPEGMPG